MKPKIPMLTTLFPSESQADYNALKLKLQSHFAPRDCIEDMWIEELVENAWEDQRLRRKKSEIISLRRTQSYRSLLVNVCGMGEVEARTKILRWHTNKTVRKEVETALRHFGLGPASVDLEAMRMSLKFVDYIDRRLNELSARRDKILRLFEDYRAGLSVNVTEESRSSTDRQ